jgi:sugar phosphate permease
MKMMNQSKQRIPVRWWILFWLFMSYVVWYLDRTNISIAATHIMKEYNWNAAQFGMVMSAFFIGYALTQIPGGWLSDRFGGSKVIQFGTIWWSIFTMLTPAGITVATMSAIRLMMGVGEGVNAPAHIALTTQWMPRREYARACALFLLGMPVGIMLTMPTAAWITNAWGWRWVFYIFGAVGFTWCLIWYYYGRDIPEQHPSISKEEIDLIRGDQDPPEIMKQPLRWKIILSDWSVWATVISYFSQNYSWYLFMSWLPGYLILARGFSFTKTTYSAMIPYILASFSIPFSGWLSDKLTQKFGPNKGRRWLISAGFLGAALFTVLSGYTSSGTMVVVYLTLAVGFLTLNHPPFHAIPQHISAKDGGVIFGMVNTSGTVAGILAPALTGFIAVLSGNHWEYALYFAAAVSVCGAITILTMSLKVVSADAAPEAPDVALTGEA